MSGQHLLEKRRRARVTGVDAMADYDYQCQTCHKQFTVSQTFGDHDKHREVRCPECGSTKVERVIHDVHVKTARKS
jgi:putative FmdB family regulatory protein